MSHNNPDTFGYVIYFQIEEATEESAGLDIGPEVHDVANYSTFYTEIGPLYKIQTADFPSIDNIGTRVVSAADYSAFYTEIGPFFQIQTADLIPLTNVGPVILSTADYSTRFTEIGTQRDDVAEFSTNLTEVGPSFQGKGEFINTGNIGKVSNFVAEYSINFSEVGPFCEIQAADFASIRNIGSVTSALANMSGLISIINRWGFRTEQGTLRGYQPAHMEPPEIEQVQVPLLIDGLKLWLDGESAITSGVDNSVIEWVDKSANGNLFIQGTLSLMPTGITSEGVSGVSFGGGDVIDASGGAIFTGNTGEIFVVYKDTGLQAGASTLLASSESSTVDNWLIFRSIRTSTLTREYSSNLSSSQQDVQGTGPSLFGVTNVVSFRSDGATVSIRPSGGSVDEITHSPVGSNTGRWFSDIPSKDNVTIGGLRINTFIIQTVIAELFEIVVFDGVVLTEPERQLMFDYLNNKYDALL